MNGLIAAAIAAQRRIIVAGVACAILAALSAVGLLALSGLFLAGAAIAGLSGIAAVQAFNYLLPSAAIRAAAIIRTGARYGERMLGHRAALFALARIRVSLFDRVAAGMLAGRAVGRPGELAARLGKDVDLLEGAVIRRISRPGAWAGGIAGLAGAFAMGWRAALIFGAALALMRMLAGRMAARDLPARQDRIARAHAAMQADYAEMARPAVDIAVHDLGARLAAGLAARADELDAARGALALAEARIGAVQTVVAAAALSGMVLAGQGQAGSFAFGLLAALAAFEVWATIAATEPGMHEARQAEARIADLADEPSSTATPLPALPPRPALEICGQSFAPGSRIRIAGASGAGKTRLLETLAGLRDDAPQPLRIGGISPATAGLAGLRDVVALCAQDAPLIAGTVADNLGLARPRIAEAEMWRALQIACADDMVHAMPHGLHEWLGGEGARLSGGQRRRLVLARGILAQRAWLLLDEPSEGLDSATERDLVRRLDEWLGQTGTGLVLVSHRPAMAALAGQVIRL